MNSGETYSHVRALERGLKLLTCLNSAGRSDPRHLAGLAGIDRTTAYRLLSTLESLGYVSKSPSDGQYVLTPMVRDLSEGLTETDRTARIVCEALFSLLRQVMWPTDFATFDSGWMVIRETTHRFSPYSVHRAMVGTRRPLLDTALGRAILVGASEAHREEMLEIALRHGAIPGDRGAVADRVALLLADYRQRGYVWAVGGADPRISAIGLPLQGPTHVIGGINVLFFSSAMSVEMAAERFLPPLCAQVAWIEERLRDQIAGQD
ncbi:MAG: helix-turn-helix domain-containing protein [Sphingomonadales bacterium]|nr:helix-turn-helix domain-containing protein [Sphingomonadales bacterium]MDE2170593.1 helix-turn-helix domain-containing protein [Sphingomonadales bacterium]